MLPRLSGKSRRVRSDRAKAYCSCGVPSGRMVFGCRFLDRRIAARHGLNVSRRRLLPLRLPRLRGRLLPRNQSLDICGRPRRGCFRFRSSESRRRRRAFSRRPSIRVDAVADLLHRAGDRRDRRFQFADAHLDAHRQRLVTSGCGRDPQPSRRASNGRPRAGRRADRPAGARAVRARCPAVRSCAASAGSAAPTSASIAATTSAHHPRVPASKTGIVLSPATVAHLAIMDFASWTLRAWLGQTTHVCMDLRRAIGSDHCGRNAVAPQRKPPAAGHASAADGDLYDGERGPP